MQAEKDYYRAIDGLRALAIGLVLVFHSRLSWFPGGFIGVDVFFVISGFLITRLILLELDAGSFSFEKFYLRRIARLMPALFCTILATLLLGILFLDPIQLEELSESSFAAIFSVSNFLFWFRFDYFSSTADSELLLHTWSLAVEEQFYLLWPLVILGVVRLFKKGAQSVPVLMLGVASIAICVFVIPYDQEAVFYLMPFRVHQFVLGAALAFAGPLKSEKQRGVIGVVGIIALLMLGIGVEGGLPAPLIDPIAEISATMLLPACAATLVIWGANSSFTKSILTIEPLLWIGRRSYSIYLVHWPLGVYFFHTFERQSELLSVVLILLSIIAGSFMHWAIEKRFRLKADSTFIETKTSILASITIFLSVLFIASLYKVSDGLPVRLSEEVRGAYSGFDELITNTEAAMDHLRCLNLSSQQSPADYDRQYCTPSSNGEPKYLILGDSWAANTYLLMKNAYPSTTFHRFGVAGCRVRLLNRFKPGELEYCQDLYRYAFEELIEKENYAGVIVSSSWEREYSQTAELVAYLLENNVRPIVIGHYLIFPRSVPNTVFGSISMADAFTKLNDLNVAIENTNQRDEELSRALGPGIQLLRPLSIQCGSHCEIADSGNRLLYRDTNHFTSAGGQFFAETFRKNYPNLFIP